MDRTAAIRSFNSVRLPRAHKGPLAASALAISLVIAILTDGAVPSVWTTTLLLLTLPLNLATALWLIGPGDTGC